MADDQQAQDNTGAASQQPQPVASAGNDNVNQQPPSEGDGKADATIQNPEAFYKAQAEKNERLFKKAEAEISELRASMDNLQTSQAEAIQKKLDSLTGELEQQKAAAEQARIEAVRVKTLVEHGLTPDMVEFVTATDPEQIAEQAKKLAGFATKPQRPSKIGHGTGSQSGVDLSWLPGHPDYRKSSFSGGWQDEE